MATEGHATCRHVTHPFVLAADYLVRLFCGSLLFDNLLAASTEHPGESAVNGGGPDRPKSCRIEPVTLVASTRIRTPPTIKYIPCK